MKILLVEQDEILRADLVQRIEEAGKRTLIKGISITGSNLKELGSFMPDAIFIGPFALTDTQDVLTRIHAIFPRLTITLLLPSEEYVAEAIDLRRAYPLRVLALGDIPQIAQVIFDHSYGVATKGKFGKRGRVISVVHTKGGVGASTLLSSIGASVAERKMPTLLIDLSVVSPLLTSWGQYGVLQQNALKTFYESGDRAPGVTRELIHQVPCESKNLFLIGQFERFIDSFHLHIDNPNNEHSTFDMMESLLEEVSDEFEYVFLDLGNHWGIATLSALAISTHVLFVVEGSLGHINRSFADLGRISAESEDPSEFDFRRWNVIVNGVHSLQEARNLFEACETNSFLDTTTKTFGVPMSGKGMEWFTSRKTLYELGDKDYKVAIDAIIKDLFPTL
jgi:Mrp family chromosome partitioning ATPase